MVKQSFLKSDRLKSNKSIEFLIRKGRILRYFPLKAHFIIAEVKEPTTKSTIKAAFIVPKRLFKKAIDRNRLKRLMREAFRKNKGSISEYFANSNKSLDIAFVFIGDQTCEYIALEQQIITMFEELKSKSK
ncbi:MAG: ribonuclease P protein component [Bacteroidales bacterium]|jgi:ribonuclease P protein component|nr:ribonuclease P protein component [Bacteroidales bacterium]